MKISDSEIARAIQYLAEGGHAAPSALSGLGPVDPALMEAVRCHLRGVPDVREERVRHLRAALVGYHIAAEAVADKIIGRAIGDRLR